MIELSAATLETIRAHGRETYPEECCGALLGQTVSQKAIVSRAEPLANDREDQRHRRYLVSPEDYLEVERRAQRQGLEIIGFYHSHPDHPAIPSAYDRENALPFFHYVVLSVSGGQPGDVSSWVLSEDRGEFQREDLVSATTGR